MKGELTKLQKDYLEAIRFYFVAFGFFPTRCWLARKFGVTPATVCEHLTALELKGHIKRRGALPRGLMYL